MRAKLSREALTWLGLVAVTLAVIAGSILPFDHHRGIAFTFDIQFKPFELHWDLSRTAALKAVEKHRHVVGFAVFFIFAYNAFRSRKLVYAWALSTVFSFAIEVAQSFIASRSGQLQDIVANFFGIYLGLIIVYGWRELSYAVKGEIEESQAQIQSRVIKAQAWSGAPDNRLRSHQN